MPRQCISMRLKREKKTIWEQFYENPQTTFWKCATSVKVWNAAAMAALISATKSRKGGDGLKTNTTLTMLGMGEDTYYVHFKIRLSELWMQWPPLFNV